MTDSKLWKKWRLTRAHLEAAREMLPERLAQNDGSDPTQEIATLTWYNEFLEHNELELALDQLEGLGRLNDVRGGFWKTLIKAATNMGLQDRVPGYEVSFESALNKHRTSDPTDE